MNVWANTNCLYPPGYGNVHSGITKQPLHGLRNENEKDDSFTKMPAPKQLQCKKENLLYWI